MLVFQVKLDLSCLDGFCDDIDFCCTLAKEESVLVMPGEVPYILKVVLPKRVLPTTSIWKNKYVMLLLLHCSNLT
jgi:hypothetical protein